MNEKFVPRIAISIGDFNGIGPEVVLKTLSQIDLSSSTPIIFSPKKIVDYYQNELKLDFDYHEVLEFDSNKEPQYSIKDHIVNVKPFLTDSTFDIKPGLQDRKAGKVAMLSIKLCARILHFGDAHAMVTAPISKETVNLAGYKIPGHTEYLAKLTGTDDVLMMLINESLRVALVTTHVPISKVTEGITVDNILEKLQLLNYSLKYDFGIDSPRIAVFGLNPHAGDGGIIGKEEIEIIEPAIKKAQASAINAQGPFPADGFFGHQSHNNFDAILAMYHDQGLAPFKLLSFGSGVNYTAGLPIIRTSPDHGTAFDIAGKNLADPSSFALAYQTAVRLAQIKYGL